MDFDHVLKQGVEINSSGTTGTPKIIFRTPENLNACNRVAIEGQQISKKSSVLTVTRMTHAGGLLLQSLPAYTLGCNIEITTFNPYNFLKKLQNHTHTFITPAMCSALLKTKGFYDADFTGKYIAMGSDPIPASHIQSFIDRGATVFANWGMTEIGPWTINKTYTKGMIADHFILGDTFWCDTKIVNNILYVKGDICHTDDWYKTYDVVDAWNNQIYFVRRSASNAL